jgi:small-conductance mechanosensitive channel
VLDIRSSQRAARAQLRRFRRGTGLAVAITGLVLLITGLPPGSDPAVAASPRLATQQPIPQTDTLAEGLRQAAASQADRAVEEATGTLRQLFVEFAALAPKIGIAILILVLAGVAARLTRPVLRRILGAWQKGDALGALASIVIWLAALGIALSVIAGDVRALVGSVGLIGLALSWALQAPIESFTAWLLNSFRGYYRVGDRIAVGEVFGDVYRIDVLTTTVWEAGGPGKAVHAAQPTGALSTFPNSELLRSNIVNYTRDFPFVWDEVVFGIANESDLEYAMRVIAGVARRLMAESMHAPAENYRALLEAAELAFDVEKEPQVYLSLEDAWTNITVRYLVPARERRRWTSALLLAISTEVGREEHREKIIPAYPVTRVDLRQADGE